MNKKGNDEFDLGLSSDDDMKDDVFDRSYVSPKRKSKFKKGELYDILNANLLTPTQPVQEFQQPVQASVQSPVRSLQRIHSPVRSPQRFNSQLQSPVRSQSFHSPLRSPAGRNMVQNSYNDSPVKFDNGSVFSSLNSDPKFMNPMTYRPPLSTLFKPTGNSTRRGITREFNKLGVPKYAINTFLKENKITKGGYKSRQFKRKNNRITKRRR